MKSLIKFLFCAAAAIRTATANSCSSHDDCSIESYCAEFNGKPTCLYCALCNKDNQYEEEDAYQKSITGDCPAKCDCTSHGDCGDTGYCSIDKVPSSLVDDDNGAIEPSQVCQLCKTCGLYEDYSVPFDGTCPDSCYCESSAEDCDEGSVCINQGQPFGPISTGSGICENCTEICVDDWVVGDSDDCVAVCGDILQCSSHEECADNKTVCLKNHICTECRVHEDATCWTPGRIPGNDLDTTSYSYPFISIDLACPESCCDWGLDRNDFPYYGRLEWAAGPCDGSKVVNAGYIKSSSKNLLVLSAEDFEKRSRKCKVTRHEFDDGKYPPSVTEIDCTAMAGRECRSVNRTFAIWITNSDGTVEYASESYPALVTVNRYNSTCGWRPIVRFIIAIYVLIFLVIAGVIALIVYCCCCRNRRGEYDAIS